MKEQNHLEEISVILSIVLLVVWVEIDNITAKPYILHREWVSTGAAGAQTRRSLGHYLLHPLILRLLVLCAPAVLRPRALQDVLAPTDPNS